MIDRQKEIKKDMNDSIIICFEVLSKTINMSVIVE